MRKTSLLATLAVALLLSFAVYAQALVRGNIGVNHTPVVNTQAIATVAAGTGSRTHVATSCSGSINTVAAQPGITLNLRNGASGAGTVIWSGTINCAITTPCVLSSGLLHIPGTAATAMTCEWSAAPATNNFEQATLTYYDVSG